MSGREGDLEELSIVVMVKWGISADENVADDHEEERQGEGVGGWCVCMGGVVVVGID